MNGQDNDWLKRKILEARELRRRHDILSARPWWRRIWPSPRALAAQGRALSWEIACFLHEVRPIMDETFERLSAACLGATIGHGGLVALLAEWDQLNAEKQAVSDDPQTPALYRTCGVDHRAPGQGAADVPDDVWDRHQAHAPAPHHPIALCVFDPRRNCATCQDPGGPSYGLPRRARPE